MTILEVTQYIFQGLIIKLHTASSWFLGRCLLMKTSLCCKKIDHTEMLYLEFCPTAPAEQPASISRNLSR